MRENAKMREMRKFAFLRTVCANYAHQIAHFHAVLGTFGAEMRVLAHSSAMTANHSFEWQRFGYIYLHKHDVF